MTAIAMTDFYKEKPIIIFSVTIRKCRCNIKKVALYREKHGIKGAKLWGGGKRREGTKARREIAYYLSREMGVTMVDIARNAGVGASTVAMALKQKEAEE